VTTRWRNTILVIAMLVAYVGVGVAFELARTANVACPSDWSNVRRVSVENGRHGLGAEGPGTIGISALLDYMPHPSVPFGRSGQAHPLVALVTVSSNEEELRRTTVECIRIRHGDDVWARRPMMQPAQVSDSGAWRQAIADDGPEWRTGDTIAAEAWVTFMGRRYVFDFGAFPLQRGL
jgi:hypothetical protein